MRIGRLGGRFVVMWNDADETRRRYRLSATDKRAAEAEGRDVFRREIARPSGYLISDLWRLYSEDRKAASCDVRRDASGSGDGAGLS